MSSLRTGGRRLLEVSLRHTPGRRRHLRCSKSALTISFVILVLRLSSSGNRPQGAKEGELRSPGWLSQRSLRFTRLWREHRSRNVVVYLCVSTRKTRLLGSILYHLLTCPEVFYDSRYDKLFEVPDFCFRHSCLQRFGRSHYVYAEFVLRTYERVINVTLRPPKATAAGKVAVLVEPREHPLLEYTIKQVMSTLGSDWSLQLFLSSENESFIRQRFNAQTGDIGEHIIITPLARFGLDGMRFYGNRVQSGFSAHEQLYQAIYSEHILWFQVDVILRAAPQAGWLKYAYVGSDWRGCEFPSCSAHTCDKVCGGGNSGLSLRRRSKLQLVATRGKLPQDLWGWKSAPRSKMYFLDQEAIFESDELRDNSITRWFEDDLQISSKLKSLGLLAPGDTQQRFAIAQALLELKYDLDPAGLHKPWMTPWFEPDIIIYLLEKPYRRTMGTSE